MMSLFVNLSSISRLEPSLQMANTVNDIEPIVRIYNSNLQNMGRFHDESLFATYSPADKREDQSCLRCQMTTTNIE